MNLSDNAKGVLLAGMGVLVLSPDSLLIRLIDTDLWTLVFLRGLFMGISLFLLNFLVNRKSPMKQFLKLDRYAWGVVLIMAISNYFFVFAIQHTSVAHTLIIVGAAPVFAAILGLIFLKEKVSKNTWFTIFIVVTGLVFVVNDDVKSSLVGDVYAMIACLFWSTNFILARKTTMSNMIAPMCISGVLISLYSYPYSELALVTQDQIYLSMLLGVFVGIAFSMITLAPRYIPAAEVAVFMPSETVFGVLLVWWFIGEFPGLVSVLAGSIIILAIMLNSYFQIRNSSN